MADLYWGVSDALDLYDEYVNAQKDIKQKIVTTTDTAENVTKVEESTETNPKEAVPDITTEAVNEKLAVNKTAGDNNFCKDLGGGDDISNKSYTISTDLAEEATIPSCETKEANVNNEINSTMTAATIPVTTPVEHVDNESIEFKRNTGGEEVNHVESLSEPNTTLQTTDDLSKTADLVSSLTDTCENQLPIAMEEPQTEMNDQEEANELKILICGGGDPRHIIKTMAKRYTHGVDVPVLKFYIIEGCIEIIARNILLLGIACERPELISLRHKVHLFMDVYGNTLLRPFCYQYLVSKAATLLKMVTDKETCETIAPFLKINDLKYRERDSLLEAIEFWLPKPGYVFNIQEYWKARLRRLLAVRYDTRDGVFDWDLNMSLKDRGAQQICSQEYRYWRETGIAFTYPEYEQCKPNKTLSAGLVRNGNRYVHRGYVGDIQTGPFCTFGLRSLEERMHRSAHGENDYRATDVTERNLLEYFFEIESGIPYDHNEELSRKYGGVRFQMGELLTHDEGETDIFAYDQPWINVNGVEVHFLSLNEMKMVGQGSMKWHDFFDVAFVGYKFFELLQDNFVSVLRKNALLILETKLRSVEIKNRIEEFEMELKGFARDANLESVLNYNALNTKNSILKFRKP